MLEKFYFEIFLIAFSALIGAIFSFAFNWLITKSGLDPTRKLVAIISLFFIMIIAIGIVLWLLISIIGWQLKWRTI